MLRLGFPKRVFRIDIPRWVSRQRTRYHIDTQRLCVERTIATGVELICNAEIFETVDTTNMSRPVVAHCFHWRHRFSAEMYAMNCILYCIQTARMPDSVVTVLYNPCWSFLPTCHLLQTVCSRTKTSAFLTSAPRDVQQRNSTEPAPQLSHTSGAQHGTFVPQGLAGDRPRGTNIRVCRSFSVFHANR